MLHEARRLQLGAGARNSGRASNNMELEALSWRCVQGASMMMMRAALEKLEERLVRRGGKQGIRGPCSRSSNLYGVSPQRSSNLYVRGVAATYATVAACIWFMAAAIADNDDAMGAWVVGKMADV